MVRLGWVILWLSIKLWLEIFDFFFRFLLVYDEFRVKISSGLVIFSIMFCLFFGGAGGN